MTNDVQRQFKITAKIESEVTIKITASNLEDALAQGKELGVEDFVQFRGAWSAKDLVVRGVEQGR